MRQIFWIIIIAVVVIFGAAWFIHRSKTHTVNSGDVVMRGQPSDKAKTDATAGSGADTTDQPTEPEQPAPDTQTTTPAPGSAQPPATDSIPRNPPNGTVFAGKGKYQIYRQGDITWRLNTDTGHACILFATNAEWRNPRVFQHGCGGS
jgi:hypothetical protein